MSTAALRQACRHPTRYWVTALGYKGPCRGGWRRRAGRVWRVKGLGARARGPGCSGLWPSPAGRAPASAPPGRHDRLRRLAPGAPPRPRVAQGVGAHFPGWSGSRPSPAGRAPASAPPAQLERHLQDRQRDGAPRRERNGNYKNARFTNEAIERRRSLGALLRALGEHYDGRKRTVRAGGRGCERARSPQGHAGGRREPTSTGAASRTLLPCRRRRHRCV